MGVFSKKIALIAMGCLAAAAGADPTDASACPDMANDDDVPELMKVQLLQSDLSVRRSKARAARQETAQDDAVRDPDAAEATTVATATDDGAVDASASLDVDAQAVQLEDDVSLLAAATKSSLAAANEQLDAEVEQLTDKVDQIGVKDSALSVGVVQDASIAFHVKKALNLLLFRTVTAIDTFHLVEQYPHGSGGYPSHDPSIGEIQDDTGLLFVILLTQFLIYIVIFAGSTLISAAVWRCLRTPVACQMQPGQSTETEPTGQWSHDLFDCFSACDICLCAWFCPAIRWSETMGYVPALTCCGVGGFWGWLCIVLLAVVPSMLFPFVLVLFVAQRSALRQQFKIAGSCPMDCLFYCFCAPCAMTQEGREVEDAVRKGSKYLVGDPVAV